MLQNVPQPKIQGKVYSPEGWTLAEAMVGAVDREDAKPEVARNVYYMLSLIMFWRVPNSEEDCALS